MFGVETVAISVGGRTGVSVGDGGTTTAVGELLVAVTMAKVESAVPA